MKQNLKENERKPEKNYMKYRSRREIVKKVDASASHYTYKEDMNVSGRFRMPTLADPKSQKNSNESK